MHFPSLKGQWLVVSQITKECTFIIKNLKSTKRKRKKKKTACHLEITSGDLQLFILLVLVHYPQNITLESFFFFFLLTIVFQPFQGLLYTIFNGLYIYTIIYLTKASCLKLKLIIVLYHYRPSLDIYFVFIYWWLCNLGADFLREKTVFILITYSPITWCLAIWI